MSEHRHEHEENTVHQHIHGEDCGCENHAHIHGEDCGCEEHNHTAASPIYGEAHVECNIVDDARVISGGIALFGDYRKIKPALDAQLHLLSAAIQHRGGIVGHIKASATVKSVDMFSVTDLDVTVKTAQAQEVDIILTAIVFAIEPDDAGMLVRQALEALNN